LGASVALQRGPTEIAMSLLRSIQLPIAMIVLVALARSAPSISISMMGAFPAQPTYRAQDGDHRAEYEKRRKEAGDDIAKLWSLYDWCDAYGMQREAKQCLRAIVRLDEGNRKAHELLGDVYFDGKWFTSAKKLEEYKRQKTEAEAKKTGKVLFKDQWVDPADVPYLEKGLVKAADGRWVDPVELQRTQEGWVRQDLTWIPPDEIPQIEKGLWKCGEAWLPLEEANRYHAELGQWWSVPGEHFIAYSTGTRELTEKSLLEAERAFKDLVRIFGRAPGRKVPLLVLNSREQYSRFAQAEEGAPVELQGFSSLHGAFLAEIWREPIDAGSASAGVAYWDASNAAGNSFGPTFVRHAAGLSFAEELDPSPKSLQSLRSGGGGGVTANGFWSEKLLPAWFRYGAAAYVERYLFDTTPGNEPMGLRNWSIANIANKGGLDPVTRIFAFELSLDDLTGSSKLINEAGLLVAFILDGKCAPVIEKHQAFKAAFNSSSGKDPKEIAKAARALEEEIKKREGELRKFAGL
jgi:hypothetical protein